MKTDKYRDRKYVAFSTREHEGVYRGGFDIDSTSSTETDGVINEMTTRTFSTAAGAEAAAVAAARNWIDSQTDRT